MTTHRRSWRLLPWYANGTLTGDERREVRDHLEECADCREELQRCRALGELYESAASAAPAPHPARIERLWDRIRSVDRSEEPSGRRTLPWRWIALTEAAVIVALIGSIAATSPIGEVSGPEDAAPAYRTLSSTESPDPSAEAPLFRVVFASETTEREIRDTLLSLEGRVVAGPTPYGVYTVAVPAARDGDASVEGINARLRKQSAVRFAEPVSDPAPAPAPD